MLKEIIEEIEKNAEERKRGIEQEAAIEKGRAVYITDIVQSNYALLKEIFDPDSRLPEKELPRYLFDSTMETIESLGSHFYDPYGPLSPGREEYYSKSTKVRLGWLELGEIDGEPALYPTKEGLDVYNGWRIINRKGIIARKSAGGQRDMNGKDYMVATDRRDVVLSDPLPDVVGPEDPTENVVSTKDISKSTMKILAMAFKIRDDN